MTGRRVRMLPWDPLWRLQHVGYPVSPRGYRGLPAFASLSMAGSEGGPHLDAIPFRTLLDGEDDLLRHVEDHLQRRGVAQRQHRLVGLHLLELLDIALGHGAGKGRLELGVSPMAST